MPARVRKNPIGRAVVFEYRSVRFDFSDLQLLNELATEGWRVVAVKENGVNTFVALLERPK